MEFQFKIKNVIFLLFLLLFYYIVYMIKYFYNLFFKTTNNFLKINYFKYLENLPLATSIIKTVINK